MRSLLMCAAAMMMVTGLASVVTSAATGATSDVEPLPDWPKLQQVVSRDLATLPDYLPGDLIVESNVMPMFDHFQQMGWNVTERRVIQRQLIKYSDFIAKKLRTKNGKKFMRNIAKYPDAFDRLYRWRRCRAGVPLSMI